MVTYSVVIPTLNEEKNIPRLVKALKSQTFKPLEIIVVDGGSSDKTYLVAKKLGIKVIKSSPPVARQRNIGAKVAKGEWVVFLDADTYPNKDFFRKYFNYLLQKNFSASCPLLKPVPGGVYLRLVYGFFDMMFILFQKIAPSGAGSCLFVKKDLFGRSKGFCETLSKYEDAEYISRLSYLARYGIILILMGVSDRRFRKYGYLKTTAKYIFLSPFFIARRFKPAQIVPYSFGEYSSEK